VRHIDVSGQRLAIFETDHSSALSGGSNRATVLFLNASPYRAIFHPYCIQDQDHIGATTILTRGGGAGETATGCGQYLQRLLKEKVQP